MLNGGNDRNDGFPSHLDDLEQLAAGREHEGRRSTCSTCRARPGCTSSRGPIRG